MSELALEVDGPDVHTKTAGAAQVLELAASYFALLEKLAEERHSPTRFVGLSVVEKCISLVSTASTSNLVIQAIAAEAHELVAGGGVIPRGMQGAVGRVRDSIGNLPPGVHAKVSLGQWTKPLNLGDPARLFPTYRTEARAVVLRVGGDSPTATFRLTHERQTVTLRLGSVDRALTLAKLLYKEVDLVVRWRRDPAGRIQDGEILDVHELGGDASGEWKRWMAKHAGHWAGVEDVESELERDAEADLDEGERDGD